LCDGPLVAAVGLARIRRGDWVNEPGTLRATRLQRLRAEARRPRPHAVGAPGSRRGIGGGCDPGCPSPAWHLRRRRGLAEGPRRTSLGSQACPSPAAERPGRLVADAARRVIAGAFSPLFRQAL